MYCIVDFSNSLNISYSVFVRMVKKNKGDDYEIKEEDLPFFWHLFFNNIKDYFITYKDLVFCCEGKNSIAWRKSLYPPYKENRLARKDNPDFRFISQCYKQAEELLTHFHCKVIRVDNCEGDDCIYAITKYVVENLSDEVTVISSDHDLIQLMNYFEGVKVYNPIKKCFQLKNENIIVEKSLCGDSSDNISGVKGIGPKTFEKMMSDKLFWSKKMTPENNEIFQTVQKIVDLRKYPLEYQKNIVDNFSSMEYNPFDKDAIEAFFLKYGLVQCQARWSEVCGEIEMMLNGNAQAGAEKELEDLLK